MYIGANLRQQLPYSTHFPTLIKGHEEKYIQITWYFNIIKITHTEQRHNAVCISRHTGSQQLLPKYLNGILTEDLSRGASCGDEGGG
jgi:hypothetical protein